MAGENNIVFVSEHAILFSFPGWLSDIWLQSPSGTIIILYYYNNFSLFPSNRLNLSPLHIRRTTRKIHPLLQDRYPRRTYYRTTRRGRMPRGVFFGIDALGDWLGVKRSASVQCDPRAGTFWGGHRNGERGSDWRAAGRGDDNGCRKSMSPLTCRRDCSHSFHSPGPAAAV